MHRVGVVGGALGEEAQFASAAALFPNLAFDSVAPVWPERAPACEALIGTIDGASAVEVDGVVRRLKSWPTELRVVVVLRNADISTTRLLMREGAADVIPAPLTEAALALTLDKLFGAEATLGRSSPGGEVVAVLKAGGGVGATALCVQAGAMAAHAGGNVCLADLDLQFGAASLYLDMADAATVSDCMAAGSGLKDVAFDTLLGKHRSGLSLLAAPQQITPLEALAPPQTETLVAGLKRSFGLVIVDLPGVWTAWTNRALQQADRIIIVTHLSVPHMHMLDRQIATLRTQGLEDRKLTLVCNALSPDQSASLSLKSAERALGREFDVVIPDDRKLMNAAINQGAELSALRRGSKLEKAVGELAQLISVKEVAATRRRRA